MVQATATAAKHFHVTCASDQLPCLAFEFAGSGLGSGPAIDWGTRLNLPRFLFGPDQTNGQERSLQTPGVLKCPLKLQSCCLMLYVAGACCPERAEALSGDRRRNLPKRLRLHVCRDILQHCLQLKPYVSREPQRGMRTLHAS